MSKEPTVIEHITREEARAARFVKNGIADLQSALRKFRNAQDIADTGGYPLATLQAIVLGELPWFDL